jgi:pimeloyl-ACP methyl ester carboxylesterase
MEATDNRTEEALEMTRTKDGEINLRDGRSLAYSEYGRPDGAPILYCHGVPSSRVEGDLYFTPEIMANLDTRIIIPDRPGIGRSDYQENRQILDWAKDAAELTSQLGIERFGVLGSSGGAPYALACGARLPQVAAVGIMGGIAPFEAAGIKKSLSGPLKAMFWLAKVAPLVLSGLFRLNLRAMRKGGAKAGERMVAMAPEPDKSVLRRPEIQAQFMACFAAACQNGVRGAVTDTGLVARPWGVDLAGIRVPVLLWHGVQDRNVPVECGRYLAKTIAHCEAKFYANDAHLSVPLNHLAEILSSLISASRT